MTRPQTNAPPEPNPITDQAVTWFIRLSAPTAEPADHQQFQAWAKADPRHHQAYQEVVALWGSDAFTQALQGQAAQSTAAATPRSKPRSKPRPWVFRWAAPVVTASLAALLVAAQACGLSPGEAVTSQWQTAFADYATRTNQSQTITLADGSKITLAPKTALDVTQGNQGITVTLLHGKALFSVHPVAPGQQFMVQTDHAQVRVVGTAFTVETSPRDSAVAVAHGRVTVATPHGTAQTTLEQNQGTRITAEAQLVALPYPEDALAWTEGRLQFHDQPLAQVADALEARLPGLIVIPDQALRAKKVSGSYRLDDPQTVLATLAEIVGAKVTALPGNIFYVNYQ